MIDQVINAAIEPFRHPIGWQGFAYGVLGKVIAIYGKEFVKTISPIAEEAGQSAESKIQDNDENRNE